MILAVCSPPRSVAVSYLATDFGKIFIIEDASWMPDALIVQPPYWPFANGSAEAPNVTDTQIAIEL
jgi:hypothetical protein